MKQDLKALFFIIIFLALGLSVNKATAEECNKPVLIPLVGCIWQDICLLPACTDFYLGGGTSVDQSIDLFDTNACFVGVKAIAPNCLAPIPNLCGENRCPTVLEGAGWNGTQCHIDADNDSIGGNCSVNGSVPSFGVWDESQGACVTCNPNGTENTRLGWGVGNFYCNGDTGGTEVGLCESACPGVYSVCDEQAPGSLDCTSLCLQSCKDIVCNTPGPCQVNPGSCDDSTGVAICYYPDDPVLCDLDGDPCTGDRCVSTDGGLTSSCMAGSNICGGFVPCGRMVNDPGTLWDDTQSCNFCHGIMLLNQGMNFLMKIAGTVAVLALIITGFLFITSAGNPERKNNAKETFKWVIVGFLVIFLSWLIVDFLLSAWGYLDPLGGEWNVVCD
jgi:hypothetical protein